jgi:hypothetical protein
MPYRDAYFVYHRLQTSSVVQVTGNEKEVRDPIADAMHHISKFLVT